MLIIEIIQIDSWNLTPVLSINGAMQCDINIRIIFLFYNCLYLTKIHDFLLFAKFTEDLPANGLSLMLHYLTFTYFVM